MHESMSSFEIYIVGGAGLFFLASGCLKLIVVRTGRPANAYMHALCVSNLCVCLRTFTLHALVCQVSCHECWVDHWAMRATSASTGDDRLLMSAPRGDVGGQQREAGSVPLGITTTPIDSDAGGRRHVAQGRCMQHDPHWVVDGVVVSRGDLGAVDLDGQRIAATVIGTTVAVLR